MTLESKITEEKTGGEEKNAIVWLPEIITSLYESGARTEHLLKNTFKSLMFTGGGGIVQQFTKISSRLELRRRGFSSGEVVLQKSMTRVALPSRQRRLCITFLEEPEKRR